MGLVLVAHFGLPRGDYQVLLSLMSNRVARPRIIYGTKEYSMRKFVGRE